MPSGAPEGIDPNVGALLLAAAADAPDRIALKLLRDPVNGIQQSWTYRELAQRSEDSARYLMEQFEPGEHIAIWANNRPEWLFLQMGVALAGMVLVPINPSCRAADLTHIMVQSRAVGLFHSVSLEDEELATTLATVKAKAPELRHIEPLRAFAPVGMGNRPLPTVSPDQPAVIQFTSGTTGNAKGAVIPHHAFVAAQAIFERHIDFPPGSVWLNATPLHTIAGCAMVTLAALANRGTQLLLPRFTPELFCRAVAEDGAMWSAVVPTMVTMLLEYAERDRHDLSAFRVFTVGGAPVAPELATQIEAAFGNAVFCMVYGQTEAGATVTHGDREEPFEVRMRSAGRVMPGREVRIVDAATNRVLGAGETGEICVRGLVMTGYFGLGKESAAAIDAEGWLHTGDLGELDSQGYLTVTGRLKDMIIRGGLNIYPREIEDVLVEYPGIAEAAVFGAPDKRWGEIVVAAVRLLPDADAPDMDAVRRFVATRIAEFKVPAIVEIVDEFPLTPSGKIQKFALRDAFVRRSEKAAA